MAHEQRKHRRELPERRQEAMYQIPVWGYGAVTFAVLVSLTLLWAVAYG